MRVSDGMDGDGEGPPMPIERPLAHASTEVAGSAAEPMAQVRPGEPAGVLLARARVFGALFGDDSTLGSFGRFRVLERLGAGGMGVVYEAYDPDVARGVALKLVNVAAKDRDTALAEAKALGRLSHPNVVPIFDVGIEHDHVYLVMELVRGKTLRRWVEGRGARDILAVYHQAGTALAAAHAAGLVHRDFKPENAIVGADGRVRVVDFGLACEADDPARASNERRGIAGTPGFMAPEITAGTAITPAADQFSFCVALADALVAANPPASRRVASVLERGRATDPAARFPSMTELLDALERDPARIWRRRFAALGLLSAVGAAMYLVGTHQSAAAETCDASAAELDAVWSQSARAAALDRVASLGTYGGSLRQDLTRGLGDYRERWTQASRAACLDRHRGVESTAQIDRRRICLTRGLDGLEAVRELVTHIEPEHLEQLARAVQSLHDPSACSARNALLSEIEPPPAPLAASVAQIRHGVAQAQIDVGAGRYEQALSAAARAVEQARRVEYSPVLAEALLVQGHARMRLPDRKESVPILEEATRVALASRADAMAVEAWARRAWAQGTSSDPDRVFAGVEIIELLAQRAPSAAFARALLYNNLGSVELAKRNRDQARAYFARSLAESRKVAGDGALELLVAQVNIGITIDDHVFGDQLISQVAVERAKLLGRYHPDTLKALWMRAHTTIEDLRQAADILLPACEGYEQHAALAELTAGCWTEIGLLRRDLGERAGAIEAMQRAVTAHRDTPEAAAWLALLRGDAADAVRQFSDAIAARPAAPDDQWWDQLKGLYLTSGLGQARLAAKDLRGAGEALEAAVAGLEDIVRSQSGTIYDRQLGRARVALAAVLAARGERSAHRTNVEDAAAAWQRRVGATPGDPASPTAP